MPESGTVINCSTLLSMTEGGFLIGFSVGATLTGMTLIVQIAVPTLSVAAPSLTVNVTVRSGAVPPRFGLELVSWYVTESSAAW